MAGLSDDKGIQRLVVIDRTIPPEGVAYVYAHERSAAVWRLEAELGNVSPSAGIVYTAALTVGADGQPIAAISNAGAVAVWTRSPTLDQWEHVYLLFGLNKPGSEPNFFGSSVSATRLLSDEVVIFVGAQNGGDTSGTVKPGRFGVRVRPAPGSAEWVREARLLAPDAMPGDEFGAAVAVAPLPGGHPGDALALVGAPRRPFTALRGPRPRLPPRRGHRHLGLRARARLPRRQPGRGRVRHRRRPTPGARRRTR